MGGQERRLDSVLVTDGGARSALAAVRALGSCGIPAHVIAERPRSLAGLSRYAAQEHIAPDAESDPIGWAREVRRIWESIPNSLVLPITEVSLGTAYYSGLVETCSVAAPDLQCYTVAIDKHQMGARALEAGLDVPMTTLIAQPRDLTILPEGYSYPVVVKARRSRWFEGGRWHRGTVHMVRGDQELFRAVEDPGLHAGALLQEYVPGSGEGLFFLMDRGRVRVRFAHRRLREKPPWGGVSVLSEAIPPDRDLAEPSERLLRSLSWHGVVMVEFRRTPGGRAVLMEVNPRFWGSLQLAIDAGVNFPQLLVSLYRGETLPVLRPRIGVRNRWLLGDLDHLVIALRSLRMPERSGRSARRVLGGFVRSFFDGTKLEVLRRDDPRPFWAELRGWLQRR